MDGWRSDADLKGRDVGNICGFVGEPGIRFDSDLLGDVGREITRSVGAWEGMLLVGSLAPGPSS